MMKPLSGQDIEWAYDQHAVLKRLSITAQPGEVLGLIGPNGVGKTTLLRVLARILRPDHGKIFLAERDLWQMSPKEVARSLSLTPQENPSWPLTVEQVVSLGRAPHRGWLLPLSPLDHETIEIHAPHRRVGAARPAVDRAIRRGAAPRRPGARALSGAGGATAR
jgi:iron complex transport system ATP-binding protein